MVTFKGVAEFQTPMKIDKTPFFRKKIYPWYDSNGMCILTMFVMVLAAAFSVIGWMVGHQNVQYRGYVWVPILLLVLSLVVFVSTAVRLIDRISRRDSNLKE